MTAAKVLPPVLIALVLGIIALTAWGAQQPWLVPSLGSAIFTQALSPEEKGAKPYPTFAGQVIGAVAGFIAVYIAGAVGAPHFMTGDPIVGARVLAVVIAVFLASAAQLATGATSPAGGATALVIAVGAETPDFPGAIRLLIGIALVTALGEASRRIILRAKSS